MSDTIATLGVPEVAVGQGGVVSTSPSPEFSGKWEDFNKDMAAIAKEQGQVTEPAQPVEQPPQAAVTPAPAPAPAVVPPVVPQAAMPAVAPPATAPIEVPEKFRGPDGKLDQEKLMKSYLEAEKTLKRAQNAQTTPQPIPTPQIPPQGQPAPIAGPLTPFEAQVAQDMINEAAAYGYQMPQGQAIAQARVQIKLAEAKHKADTAATFHRVSQLEETLAEQTRRTELSALAKVAPEVMTPQGYAELVKIREENPWINNSPEPWRAAAQFLLGSKAMHGPAGSVNIPIPMGGQQQVPPLPVTPIPSASNPIQLNTPEQVAAYVATLSPEQEGEFWRKSGYKWEQPLKPFKGL